MQITREDISSIDKNHMPIPWHSFGEKNNSTPIKEASLSEKSTIIGRIGFMLLSCGTGAWRVRSSMNKIARELGVTVQRISDWCLLNIPVWKAEKAIPRC